MQTLWGFKPPREQSKAATDVSGTEFPWKQISTQKCFIAADHLLSLQKQNSCWKIILGVQKIFVRLRKPRHELISLANNDMCLYSLGSADSKHRRWWIQTSWVVSAQRGRRDRRKKSLPIDNCRNKWVLLSPKTKPRLSPGRSIWGEYFRYCFKRLLVELAWVNPGLNAWQAIQKGLAWLSQSPEELRELFFRVENKLSPKRWNTCFETKLEGWIYRNG